MSIRSAVNPKSPQRVLLIFLASAAAAGALAAGTRCTKVPLLLPPLGASTYLLFVKPEAPASTPRNMLLGHAIGILCGVAALAMFGLVPLAPSLAPVLDWPRVAACSMALGLTCAGMYALGVDHPPAGATTLIVSFGLCPCDISLANYFTGTTMLVAFAFSVNRLRGFDYPLWSAPKKVQLG